MGLFYFCEDCNRKYRSPHTLKKHARKDHSKELETIPEPKEFTSGRNKDKRSEVKREKRRRRQRQEPRRYPEKEESPLKRGKHEEEKKHEEEEEDDDLCTICCDEKRNAVLGPCGHAMFCLSCAHTIKQTRRFCPMCNRNIISIMKLYY